MRVFASLLTRLQSHWVAVFSNEVPAATQWWLCPFCYERVVRWGDPSYSYCSCVWYFAAGFFWVVSALWVCVVAIIYSCTLSRTWPVTVLLHKTLCNKTHCMLQMPLISTLPTHCISLLILHHPLWVDKPRRNACGSHCWAKGQKTVC